MADNRSSGKLTLPVVILIAMLLAVALALKNCRSDNSRTSRSQRGYRQRNPSPSASATEERGLNRTPSAINYSKHARCRMQCRHISESEVREILSGGKINYRKSDLGATPCRRRYAVEGYTHDNQRVRMIFAPCNTEVTVVTVIDLDKEWSCSCD